MPSCGREGTKEGTGFSVHVGSGDGLCVKEGSGDGGVVCA